MADESSRPKVLLPAQDSWLAPGQARQSMGVVRTTAEYAWASFHIWDRTRRGVFPKGTFELTGGALLSVVLRTRRGGAWWRSAKQVGFIPEFVADVDAMLSKGARDDPGVAGP